MNPNNYITDGGAEGKERLGVLGSILNKGRAELLRQLHPAPIGHFFDLGDAIALTQNRML